MTQSGSDDEMEVLDLDLVPEGARPVRPGSGSQVRPGLVVRLGVGVLLATALVAGAVAVVGGGDESRSAAPGPSGAPTRSEASGFAGSGSAVPTPGGTVSGPGPASASASPPETTVTKLGRPLLGATGTWQLVVRTRTELVRIEPARGRITRTLLPDPGENTVASLIVGSDRTLVVPTYGASATLVVDGQAAQAWRGPLEDPSTALPGPDPNHFWMATFNGDPSLRKVALDGGAPVATIALPPDLQGMTLQPDQAGGLLVAGVGGVYEVRTTGLRRVTTGTVLAAGPTRLLVRECDTGYRCDAVVVDRTTGTRRTLPASPVSGAYQQGVVAPDGSRALTTRAMGAGVSIPVLVDLRTGEAVDADAWGLVSDSVSNAAWSPDSRWLFAVVSPERMVALDVTTGELVDLGVPLPNALQVAIRP